MKRTRGRPRQNKTIKEHASIRLTKEQKEMVIKYYGSIQFWIDCKIDELNRGFL